jgi:hypothetical protein
MDFCRYLLDFLSISSLFYERTIRFFGPCILNFALMMPDGAKLFPGLPPGARLGGANLFHPPLESIRSAMVAQFEVAMNPMSAARLQDYLEANNDRNRPIKWQRPIIGVQVVYAGASGRRRETFELRAHKVNVLVRGLKRERRDDPTVLRNQPLLGGRFRIRPL